jgi:tetratricopeptide (TPR) repeat protein
MEYKTLQDKYTKCCQLVTDQRLGDAFTLLQELIAESHNNDLNIQLEKHRETYQNILHYSFGEIEDPEKKTVYYRLLRNILDLADETREFIIISNYLRSYSYLIKDVPGILTLETEQAKQFIESLALKNEVDPIDTEISAANQINRTERQKLVLRLFHHLWLTNKYHDTEKELVMQIFQSQTIPWWEKCLVVSAIILSLQRYFEESKLLLLAEAYKQNEPQVSHRALIGLMISLYQYNQRIFLYPKTRELIEQLSFIPNIQKQAELIIIQFIKAKDTEKIAQKFRDEIIPEMAKIQSRISDKLDLKNLIQDPLSEEKNPDWEHVFHDSPNLLNKLEELSMLQMDGSDVFMSTFSMLKHFDFFEQISNWFLPFHQKDTELMDALYDNTGEFDAEGFISNMERSSILCNSDKYSFCYNIKYMPVKERSMMVEMFNMEIKAMDEIAHDDEMLNKPTRERVIFTQSIQDFYRFNKLYKNKSEFYDIFDTRADFHNTSFFRWLITDESIIRNIGEFYFEKEHYQDAIDIFNRIDNLPQNCELWQKIAYSWQQLGDYQKALEYYLRADLTDIRKPWNIKKIALCYRRLGNHSKALEYYLEAEKMEPENLQVQANLAHTHLDLKDYENALKKYFKVEYMAPDNRKIQRPIAWCSFMLEKHETAKKYLEKITETEGNQHDLLNLGHVEWCLGNKKAAIEKYRKSIEKSGNNREWFTDEFMADSEILIRNGIDPMDISLMRDFILINVSST